MNYWDSWKRTTTTSVITATTTTTSMVGTRETDPINPNPTQPVIWVLLVLFFPLVNGIWSNFVFLPCWCCCSCQLFVVSVSGCVVLFFVVCLEIIVPKYSHVMKWLCCWMRKRRKRKENSYKKKTIFFIAHINK